MSTRPHAQHHNIKIREALAMQWFSKHSKAQAVFKGMAFVLKDWGHDVGCVYLGGLCECIVGVSDVQICLLLDVLSLRCW